jgi:uncharacterized protein YpmS
VERQKKIAWKILFLALAFLPMSHIVHACSFPLQISSEMSGNTVKADETFSQDQHSSDEDQINLLFISFLSFRLVSEIIVSHACAPSGATGYGIWQPPKISG